MQYSMRETDQKNRIEKKVLGCFPYSILFETELLSGILFRGV
jgi:hypothetical protein